MRLWALECARHDLRISSILSCVSPIGLRTEWFPSGHLSTVRSTLRREVLGVLPCEAARRLGRSAGSRWRLLSGWSFVLFVRRALSEARRALVVGCLRCDALPWLSIGDLSLSGCLMCRSSLLARVVGLASGVQ